MVQRMTGPGAMTATILGKEVGVSQPTLSAWLRHAGTIQAKVKASKEARVGKADTPEGRMQAVMEANALSEEELGAWLRARGLHQAQLDEWRAAMISGLEGSGSRASSREGGQSRRVRELERELARKNKALAEAAALLMLQKNSGASGGTRTTARARTTSHDRPRRRGGRERGRDGRGGVRQRGRLHAHARAVARHA